MAHVITAACIDIKDGACVACCPVDCIYEGARMLYIHPDECIDCGLCLSVCPVDAIHEEDKLPTELAPYAAVNRDYFGPGISGLGQPGSAEGNARDIDHPLVMAYPPRQPGHS